MSERPTTAVQPSDIDKEELFHLLVESAVDFAIITTDEEGLVTSWNSGGERLIGFREAEIVGRSGDVIFRPDDRAAGMPEAERATARKDGRAEDERWHMRKDGSLFWGSGLMMPLRDGGGYVKIMRDRTASRIAEEQLATSEERFRSLAVNIPQLVFRARDTGEFGWVSPQWVDYTGLTGAQSGDFNWLTAIHPDDRVATLDAWKQAATTGLYQVSHRIRREADGSYRWHQTRASPIPAEGADSSEWVGAATDVDDLRALQNRQQILLAELQHRTRNMLALVQAVARRTLRNATSLEAFAGEYESRLAALSRVQGLIASSAEATLDLRELVEAELRAHWDNDAERVSIEGPAVDLPAATAQIIALALHELATNAVKYGAIGQPEGRLAVSWQVEDHARAPRLLLDWRESGVSMPGEGRPEREGYGLQLIERALPYQLDAEAKMDFTSDGVQCHVAMPLPVSKQDLP